MDTKTIASTDTFFEQIRGGKLISDKQRIYAHIKKHPGITLNDLSRGTRIVIQTASARLSDLMDLGVVEVIATQKRIGNVTLSSDSILKVQEDSIKILENKKKRSEKKFQRCLKAVLTFEEHLDQQTITNLIKHLKHHV
jgi:predicted transcriptional regulator